MPAVISKSLTSSASNNHQSSHSSPLMKEIAQFPTIEEAYIAKGMLESYGISCRIEQNGLSSVFPAPGAYNGGITLYVAEAQAEEAVNLLKEHGDD